MEWPPVTRGGDHRNGGAPAAGPHDLEQQATAGGDGAGSPGRRIVVNAG